MTRIPLSILVLCFQLLAQNVHAYGKECRTDVDCKEAGSNAHCVRQETGCAGHESDSTCVVHVCREESVRPRLADFVKTCNSDADCGLIVLRCQCMYCARPDDVKNGIADAANKKYAADLAEKYKCSPEETKRCATAGACAQVGKSIPVCRGHSCTLMFK